jgi:hypothetical protein
MLSRKPNGRYQSVQIARLKRSVMSASSLRSRQIWTLRTMPVFWPGAKSWPAAAATSR